MNKKERIKMANCFTKAAKLISNRQGGACCVAINRVNPHWTHLKAFELMFMRDALQEGHYAAYWARAKDEVNDFETAEEVRMRRVMLLLTAAHLIREQIFTIHAEKNGLEYTIHLLALVEQENIYVTK